MSRRTYHASLAAMLAAISPQSSPSQRAELTRLALLRAGMRPARPRIVGAPPLVGHVLAYGLPVAVATIWGCP